MNKITGFMFLFLTFNRYKLTYYKIMNIHEYQAKSLLKAHGVEIQEGFVAENPEQAVMAARELKEKLGSKYFVIKAQIHAGGRGKAGGVKLAKSEEEVREIAGRIIGMQLVTPQTGPAGKKVNKVLVAQDVYYEGDTEPEEYYVSILLNRSTSKYEIVYSPRGGTDIEEVAGQSPELIFREEIDPAFGLQDFQARNIAFRLEVKGEAYKNMIRFLHGIYETHVHCDTLLLEVNPVLKTSDNRVLAVDAKVAIDDNALFRHPDIAAMRDISEEDPFEVEAGEQKLNFVKLSGNVGCMVNGAGLAMATMDLIKLSGGEPANFLDVGGGASAKTVEAGFRLILKDPNVRAILINIFGGIVRCDRVANGVVEAYRAVGEIKVPIVLRLQGTNAEEARAIIDKSGIKVYPVISFREAAEKIRELINYFS